MPLRGSGKHEICEIYLMPPQDKRHCTHQEKEAGSHVLCDLRLERNHYRPDSFIRTRIPRCR